MLGCWKFFLRGAAKVLFEEIVNVGARGSLGMLWRCFTLYLTVALIFLIIQRVLRHQVR